MNAYERIAAAAVLYLRSVASMNWILVALVCIAGLIGILAQYSVAGGSFGVWAEAHAYRFLLGIGLMFAVATIPVRFWRNAALPIYCGTIVLLVLVEVLGETGMGATRWIDLGFIRIQPSEFAKVSLVLLLVAYYDWLGSRSESHPIWTLAAAVLILAPVYLVLRQPDLGTASLIAFGGAIVMFVAGVSLYYFAGIAVLAGACAALVFASRGTDWQLLHDYQFRRIDVFLDPASDPLGAGYHIMQSKIALGSGGLTGRGFLQGTQSQLNFLPEKHTDFVFTTLAEEFGLIWGLILLAFYGAIVFYCIAFAIRSRERFSALLVLGLSGTFFLNFAVNIAMVTGLVPVVGVPLPFVSYGGSALMVLFIAFGIIQSAHIGEKLRST